MHLIWLILSLFLSVIITIISAPMEITFVGHSFIRRLKNHALKSVNCTPRGTPRGRHSDVTPFHPREARAFVRGLQLDNWFSLAYTIAENIVFIRDVISALTDNDFHSDVVVIDIGSNDIAQVPTQDPRRMLEMAHTLHELLHHQSMPLIVVNAVLPRTHRIASTSQTFSANAAHFNNFLSEMCTLSPHIIFNKLRGFQHLHIQGRDIPRPVCQWSDDGIHCTQESIQRYQQRIRHAVLDNCHRFST